MVSLAAFGLAIGFTKWRDNEQRKALQHLVDVCAAGQPASCDALRVACAKKNGEACRAIAEMSLTGRGMQRSRVEAIRYFDEACKAHHAPSCMDSGNLRRQGETPDERAGAQQWFELGCRLGDKTACRLSAERAATRVH